MKVSFSSIRKMFIGKQEPVSPAPDCEDERQIAEMAMMLHIFMRTHKPYLIRGYSIYQLSEETNISLPDLVAILEQQKYAGYNDLIDNYRIDYCLTYLEHTPARTIDVLDLMFFCGFADKNEFCATFKKITHFKLEKYIRKLQRQHIQGDGAD